jgi:hypothetical protein
MSAEYKWSMTIIQPAASINLIVQVFACSPGSPGYPGTETNTRR